MSYPQSIEYQDAVQDPRSFADPDLKSGTVATTPLGLPLALSGGFALTYTIQTGRRKLAVRCFRKEIPDAELRYGKISAKLKSVSSKYFVDFDFQSNGIRVRGTPYPIVKMEWAEGQTLGAHIDNISSNPTALASLRQKFFELATFLAVNGIAHGDIQNENVIVGSDGLKLIDYDGMFVTGMTEGRGTEDGHKHFQHPQRGPSTFGPNMDRFSFIVIDLSLEAIQAQPELHRRFREGGNAIIFNANDFATPNSSEIFSILRNTPALRNGADRLAAICEAPPQNIPTLEDFKAGRNIPSVSPRPVKVEPQARPNSYIAAFPVLDGASFSNVLKAVGDKVELVGKIISVKEGVGKRGRGKGRPYVFINFGPWNRESVKITIWSEGLGKLSSRPDQSWIGSWISVTGLIDPPYSGQHYGRPYQSVGITVESDSQVIRIKELDAAFRLGHGARRASSIATTTRPTNSDILSGIKSNTSSSINAGRRKTTKTTTASPPRAPVSGMTKNADILNALKTSAQKPSSSSLPSQPPPYQYRPPPLPAPSILSRIPVWIWIIIAIAILRVLTNIK